MDTEFALAGVEVAKEEVELSTEDEEDEDVADQVEEDQETKQEQEKEDELGQAEAAEAAACNDPPAGSPRPAAAQRATPPPRSQAGHSTAPADSDPEDGINIEEVEVVEVCEEDAEDAAQGGDEDEVDGEEDQVMGQSDAAEAAVRQAEAEGLTLQPFDNAAGYRGVYKYMNCRHKKKPFQASVWRHTRTVNLGHYATAEEAALAYARTPEAKAQVAKPKPAPSAPLTAEEAVAQAAAEGLTLEPGSSSSGYKGVSYHVCTSRYQATRCAGKTVYLGYFDTAEEAALAVARANARTEPPAAAPRPAAAKRAAPPPPKPPPAKQPRHTPTLRPVQPVPPPPRDSPAAQASTKLEAVSPAVAAPAVAAPAPMIFKDKLGLLKRELEIAPATPAIPAVAEANELMGITPGLGESLGVQLDRLLAIIAS